MNRLKILGLLVVLALGAIAAAPAPATAQVHASVNVSFFYDSLAPYGQWVNNASYGYVWHPTQISTGWRPYMNGRWLYTNAGWGFDSYEPWGWATFHYGRWMFDPYYGWVWVPGTVWSPAWVDFQVSNGYIGWAALPPGVSVGASFGFGGYSSYRSHIDPRGYNFVEDRRFLDSRVDRYVTPWDRNATYLRTSRDATRFATYDGVIANRGLPVDRVERSIRRAVQPVPIVDVASHRDIASRRDRGFAAYRPTVNARADHRPAVLAAPIARRSTAVDSRGGRNRVEAERHVTKQLERHMTETRHTGSAGAAKSSASSRRVESRPQSRAVTALPSRTRHDVHAQRSDARVQQSVKHSTTVERRSVKVERPHGGSAQHVQSQRVSQPERTVRSRQVQTPHSVKSQQAGSQRQHAQPQRKQQGKGRPHGG